MTIDVTPEAVEVLRRSLDLANIRPGSDGGVRLRAAKGLGGGSDIQIELAAAPLEGEVVVERDGVKIFVDRSVGDLYPEAVVALEPQHETVVVRAKEAAPAASPEDVG